MKPALYLSFIILLLVTNCFAQKVIITYDTVAQKKAEKGKGYVKYNDSTIEFTFDAGFNNQLVEIRIDSARFHIERYQSDPSLGLAGSLPVPKKPGKEKICIYINRISFDNFILDKRFSSMHISFDAPNETLYIRYTNKVYTYE